jgi:hypothetical protein
MGSIREGKTEAGKCKKWILGQRLSYCNVTGMIENQKIKIYTTCKWLKGGLHIGTTAAPCAKDGGKYLTYSV